MSLASLSTIGIIIIAGALVPIAINKSTNIKHETKLDGIKSRIQPAWLIIKYGTRIGDLLLDIPMESIDICQDQGRNWIDSDVTNRPSKTSFICLKGE